MLPTRSKLGSPGSLSKAATPRASKLESPLKSPSSVDRSPKSANKQARSGRAAAPPAQAVDAQDELQKVKELLAQALTDKARAMEELQEVKEKLEDAIAAQRRAQESSELDKFRADELEQAAIDAAQMKEDEWQKELEGVHNQHAIDVSALLAITQELQRVKQEFAMTAEAKNAALSHADDAMKIAEINAEKVGILSSEVGHLKGLLEAKAEAAEALKHELEAAKRAESDAAAAIEEWRKKVDMFEARLASATESERAAVESLSSAMKKLEESEIQISSLQGKAEEMQAEIARNVEDIDEGARRLEMCHQEVGELQSSVEAVKAELRRSEEEKKEAAAELENLAAERRGIEEELEAARDEAEKSKRAMEGLASALHEVSAEARDSQERILMKQAEVEDANEEAERLKMELKTKEESYRLLLSEAKEEIGSLRSALEEKELDPAARRLEDELRALKDDMGELIKKLKAATEEGEELKNRVRKAEEDAGSAMESVEAEKAENLRLKDRLLDKENELQSISQENDDLRAREAAALGRIQSLTKLLTEAESKNGGGVNEGENSEEYDILPKAADIPDDSAAGGQPPEKDEPNESPALQKSEGSGSHPAPPAPKADEPADEEASAWDNCHVDKDSSHQDDPETEALDEGVQPIAEHAKDGASDVVENGNVAASGSPPSKQPLHDPKKKKPLLRKFGNLLKKKSNPK